MTNSEIITSEILDAPFYTDIRIRGSESNHWRTPVIVIWMQDYAESEGEK